MNIKIEQIKIENFKGLKDVELDVTGAEIVRIFGANASGKSTIVDAFNWCLFGKNTEGKTQFGIKRTDANGNIIPKIDHSVSVVLNIDGNVVKFARTLTENWVKQRGTVEPVMTGNTIQYFRNDVEVKKASFDAEINAICDDRVFRVVTNPLTFLSEWTWQEQREMLVSMVGIPTLKECAEGDVELEHLVDKIADNKIEDFVAELASRRKKMNTEIEQIPVRVDTLEKMMPTDVSNEFDSLSVTELQECAKKILDDITSKKKAMVNADLDKLRAEKAQAEARFDAELKMAKVNHQNEITRFDNEIATAKTTYTSIVEQIKTIESGINARRDNAVKMESMLSSNIQNTQADQQKKREEWVKVSNEQFVRSEEGVICPLTKLSCGHSATALSIESQLREQFDAEKSARLAKIVEEGKKLAEILNDLNGQIANQRQVIANPMTEDESKKFEDLRTREIDAMTKVDTLTAELNQRKTEGVPMSKILPQINDEIKNLDARIAEMQSNQVDVDAQSAIDAENIKYKEVTDAIAKIQTRIDVQKQIDDVLNREKELAKNMTAIEKDQSNTMRLQKIQFEELARRVNGLFENDEVGTITFRLYTQQINGGEKQTCVMLFDGVEFDDVNTAGKYNAGLRIIKQLQQKFDIVAPIFVDNAESITTFPRMNNQMLFLTVSGEDKNLRIEKE